eukprot:TRINITY_DN3166_c0_g1_i1.p1 TRINITY_DN3166_c0_g1~~TRINITY_DN3166_c0_g1_i1.p1  ORF type:complete len:205 (+),score=59.42 TRINITY_DN3166_c0_g1_i1:170-784(+)
MSKIPQIKVVFLGDSGVGKTCMIHWFAHGKFNESSNPTLGAMFISKVADFPDYGMSVKFQVWDTAGQEKYRSLAAMYYQDAVAAVLVYNITNKESFNGITYWMSELKAHAPENIKIAIAANKSDLVDQEAVSLSEGKKFAEDNNAIFKMTSAKDGTGINQLFMSIPVALGIFDKKDAATPTKGEGPKGVSLDTKTDKKPKDNCC